ncbi:hypothetical protein [Glutamicibacter uratoxydans]|uniref:hypothetical protein n=1 Tax=Glutamicibacter uratoxydans TaxID=43667 RepID=UPI003D6EF437
MRQALVRADLGRIDVQTGQFDTVASWALGSAIVLVAISMIMWAMVIPVMRRNGRSTMAEGINKLALGVVAAALLSGAVSFATWNSTSATTTGLMPVEARTGSLTIEKRPALSTCPSGVVRNFDWWEEEIHGVSYEVLRSLIGDGAAAQFKDQVADTTGNGVTRTENAVASVHWIPTGPDCTSNNFEAQPASTVTVMYYTTDKPWVRLSAIQPPPQRLDVTAK